MGLARDTFRHTAVYSVANVIGRASSLILLPFYAYLFDTEGYGVMGMIDASVGVLAIAFGGAAQNAFLRVFHGEPRERQSRVVGTAVRLCWLFVAVLVAIPLAVSDPLTHWLLGSDRHQALVILALLALLVDVPGAMASTTLIVRQDSVIYSAISVARLVLSLVGNIALVFGLGLGLLGVFVTSFVVAALTSALFHAIAIREHGLAFDRDIAAKLSRLWLPLIPGDLFAYVGRQAERFLVRAQMGIEALGILEMAYKFAPLINQFFMLPFLRAWQTKSMEIAPRPEAPAQMADVFVKFVFTLLVMAVYLASCIRDVILLLTPPSFWPAIPIARIEIATTVVAGGSAFITFGLLYGRRSAAISRIKMSVASVKVALSSVMIWRLGLAGAALSALIMELVTFGWLYRGSQREYRVPVPWARVATLCATACACVALAVLASRPGAWATGIVEGFVVSPLLDLARAVLPATASSDAVWSVLSDRRAPLAGLCVSAVVATSFLPCAMLAHPSWWRRWTRPRAAAPAGSQRRG